jgi:peptidoglycan/LPS O-acetylase OafA/YrhL
MMVSARQRIELPSLDGIRGIGSLFVVLVHADAYFSTFCGRIPLLMPSGSNLHLEMLVDMFFILSGLVMNHVYGRQLPGGGTQSLVEFYVARVARIFPLYYATLAATALIAPFGFSYAPEGFHLALGYLLQQSVFLGFMTDMRTLVTWNTPAWSVQVEMISYLFFPVIAFLIARYPGRWTVLGGLVLCAVVLFVISHGGNLNIAVGRRALLRGFCGFTAGTLLYETVRYGWLEKYRKLYFAAAYGSLLIFSLCWQDALLVVAEACFIVLCLDRRSSLFSVLNSRWGRWLGEISYSTYLWHRPVQFLITAVIMASGVHSAMNPTLTSVMLVVLSFPLTLVVAHWSFKLIEKPGRNLIRSSYKALAMRLSPVGNT